MATKTSIHRAGCDNNNCNTQMWEVSTTTDTSNCGSIAIGRITLVEVLQHGQDSLQLFVPAELICILYLGCCFNVRWVSD